MLRSLPPGTVYRTPTRLTATIDEFSGPTLATIPGIATRAWTRADPSTRRLIRLGLKLTSMVSIASHRAQENKKTAPMPGSAASTSGLNDTAKWAIWESKSHTAGARLVIWTVVYDCRCPLRLRIFLRRRNFWIMIFLERNWLTIFATTRAPFDDRGADRRTRVPARDQEDLREDDLVPGLPIAMVDVEVVAFADFELMATVFDNRIHPSKLLGVCGPHDGRPRRTTRTWHDPRAREGAGHLEDHPQSVGKRAIVIFRRRIEKSPPSNRQPSGARKRKVPRCAVRRRLLARPTRCKCLSHKNLIVAIWLLDCP